MGDRVAEAPHTLSPWSVAQVTRMVREGFAPTDLLGHAMTSPALDRIHGVRHPVRHAACDLLATSQVRIDLHLSAFLNDRRRDVPEATDAIDVLWRRSTHSQRPAKRLGRRSCTGGHVAAGGEPEEMAAVDAAAAVELLHTFASCTTT